MVEAHQRAIDRIGGNPERAQRPYAFQVAVVVFARGRLVEAVIASARTEPSGLARLRTLLDHWTVHAETPLFAGGCFRAADFPAYDTGPGPVRGPHFRVQRD